MTAVRRALAALPDWYVADLAAGGVVEELIAGAPLTSPSVQIDMLPDGAVHVLATHEQLLGGATDQVYMGCRFPADAEYAPQLDPCLLLDRQPRRPRQARSRSPHGDRRGRGCRAAVRHRSGTGVVHHMLGGLAIDGRLGLTSIGHDAGHAGEIHEAGVTAIADAAR